MICPKCKATIGYKCETTTKAIELIGLSDSAYHKLFNYPLQNVEIDIRCAYCGTIMIEECEK
jgi:hypothetical protein